jgi:predicted kinase
MAALFLLMGVPGTDKAQLARRLESERPALRLSPDAWTSRIAGEDADAARRQAVYALQLDVAESVLRLGSDVILESEFLHRADRDQARERALAAGAETHLIFVNPPIDELLHGLTVRHGELPPETPPLSRSELEICVSRLEQPAPDEPLWTWG